MNLWIVVLLLAICYGSETCDTKKVTAFVSKKPWIALALGLVLVFLWKSQRNEGLPKVVSAAVCNKNTFSDTYCPKWYEGSENSTKAKPTCVWGGWQDSFFGLGDTFKTHCCGTEEWLSGDSYDKGCKAPKKIPHVDCVGTWSPCTKDCNRTFTKRKAQSGTGNPCPKATNCNPGEGQCPPNSKGGGGGTGNKGADVNCDGKWSLCTKDCEKAGGRKFAQKTAQSGTGDPCPKATDCKPGEGQCPLKIPNAASCTGTACTIEGQLCPGGKPGTKTVSGGTTTSSSYLCKDQQWVKVNKDVAGSCGCKKHTVSNCIGSDPGKPQLKGGLKICANITDEDKCTSYSSLPRYHTKTEQWCKWTPASH